VECQFLFIALALSASVTFQEADISKQYVQNAAACPRPNKIPRHLSLCDNIIRPMHCCDNVTGTRHTLRYISLLPNFVCVCILRRWKILSGKRVLHIWDTHSVSRRDKLRQLSSALKRIK
jgi:hypothetical protein